MRNLENKALAGALIGLTLLTACGDKKPAVATATPTSSGNVGTVHLKADKAEVEVGTLSIKAVDSAIATAIAVPTPTAARPTATPEVRRRDDYFDRRPTATPEARQLPNWIASGINEIPNDGSTVIDRTVGPHQIVAISGGPITVNKADIYGNQQVISTLPGGSDRVSLVLFLGDVGGSTRPIHVTGVVPFHNWVGTFNLPDGNPVNPQNWNDLMNAKVQETMTQSSSISGGARFVDVEVIDGNGNILTKTTFTR
jgi:hypothetical protein